MRKVASADAWVSMTETFATTRLTAYEKIRAENHRNLLSCLLDSAVIPRMNEI